MYIQCWALFIGTFSWLMYIQCWALFIGTFSRLMYIQCWALFIGTFSRLLYTAVAIHSNVWYGSTLDWHPAMVITGRNAAEKCSKCSREMQHGSVMMVSFLQDAHKRHPHLTLTGELWVVFCEFNVWSNVFHPYRDQSGYGLNQWGTKLQCNTLSHWLSPYPGLSLWLFIITGWNAV